jgi:hypothetical protein
MMKVSMALLMLAASLTVAPPVRAQAPTGHESILQVVNGWDDGGAATAQWQAMLRKRLDPQAFDSVAAIRKPLAPDERVWRRLILDRAPAWKNEIPALVQLFEPASPPANVLIVLGNRGGEDAFTHDPTTMGFDLAALQANYRNARAPANQERIDRFFRHEYTHLMQKAWLTTRPWTADTPVREALLDIWLEGLGNYFSLGDRWKTVQGTRSEPAAQALAELEPRFVQRMAALACAPPEAAVELMSGLSTGPFDQKWGALPVALWLELDMTITPTALRQFVEGGPEDVWEFAVAHLPPALARDLTQAQEAATNCQNR